MADRMDRRLAVDARMQAFARAIRARRKVLRLTQVELSRLAGCGPDFVYDVEVGKATLRLDKLLELLRVLGLELVLEEGREALRVGAALEVPAPRPGSPVRARKRASRR